MIRSVLFALVFWPVFGLYITLMLPIAIFSSQKFVFKYVFRACTKYLFWCLKHICKIEFRIQNVEALRRASTMPPMILGCNHQSAWETFLFSLYFEELTIVIKKELLRIPIAKTYFRKLGCVAIDRANAMASMKGLVSCGQKAVSSKQNILIFANGTRSVDDAHTEYKAGIYLLYSKFKLPVLPIHVDSGKCWPKNGFKKVPGGINVRIRDRILPGMEKREFFETFRSLMKD